MIEDIRKKMREIPGMDILLTQDWVLPWIGELGRETVKRVLNGELTRIRRRMLAGEDTDVSADALRKKFEALLSREGCPRLRRVINATGVVIHTNLGRSLLAEEAVAAVVRTAGSYSNLEYDLARGARGQRNAHVEELLCALTGAEACLVVNNNAGAVLLCLAALSRGTEVVVSRGELVEIGGTFRIPEIMELSGAELVEAGTTNRTHLEDYAAAISERTSMLLKVHPSNFRMDGFTAAPERSELAALAHERGLLFMEDAGSGLLVDGRALGLSGECDVRTCIEEGADIVTFSGDKMLGGPQIGVIAGRRGAVNRLREHPIHRTLRVDKMTLAAFEATMRLYAKGDLDRIPTLAMLRRTPNAMHAQARRLAAKLRRVTPARVEVVAVEDAVGGGSYPALPLSGWGIAVGAHPAGGAGRLQALLREQEIPVVCGAREDALVLHVRTITPRDEALVVEAFARIGTEGGENA